MVFLVVIVLSVLAVVLRSRLSVDNPGRLQIVFEDMVTALGGMLDGYRRAEGPALPHAGWHGRVLHPDRQT